MYKIKVFIGLIQFLFCLSCFSQRHITLLNIEGLAKTGKGQELAYLEKVNFKNSIDLDDSSTCDFIDSDGTPYQVIGPKSIDLRKVLNKALKTKDKYIPVEQLVRTERIASDILDGPDIYIIKPTPYSSTITMKFDSTIKIEWFVQEWSDSKEFTITFEDFYGKTIKKIKTDNSYFDLNLKEFRETKELIVEISSRSSTQTRLFLDKKTDYVEYNGALNQLLIGLFLESKGNFDYAKKYYESAKEIGNSPTYQSYYDSFLTRMKKFK